MNNRLPDFIHGSQDAQESTHFLHNAVNVDITTAGTIKRRKGFSLEEAAADGHSLFGHPNTQYGYYVDYTSLKYVRVNNDGSLYTATVLTGLAPGKRMFYDDSPLGVICSNGDVLKLLVGQVATDLTLPIPAQAPVLSTGSGSLVGGQYQVAICRIDTVSGRQGGTTVPVNIVVPDNSSLSVGAMDPAYTHAVYVTTRNGEVFFLADTVQAASITFAAPIIYGPRCETVLLAPMPPGSLLRYYLGRLYTVIGNTLYFSEPYAPSLFDPVRGYIPFQEPITIVEPVVGGVYVASENTYFLSGVISDSIANAVVPYGAAFGCSGRVANTNDVWWMSNRGIIRGDQAGNWKNLQEDSVAVEPATSGAGLFREEDGMKQFIATLFNPGISIMGAKTWMEAEAVRRDDSLDTRTMPSATTLVSSTMDAEVVPQ
jgi:hypothetical protein